MLHLQTRIPHEGNMYIIELAQRKYITMTNKNGNKHHRILLASAYHTTIDAQQAATLKKNHLNLREVDNIVTIINHSCNVCMHL